MSNYPSAIDDAASLPLVVDAITPVTATTINRLRTAIVAIQGELDADPSDGYATVKARLDALQLAIESAGVSAHASTHEEGGSDEIAIQNLGSGAAVANKVMVTDGAGGLTLEDYGAGGSSFTAGGDLTGDDTEQTVSFIQGVPSPDPADIGDDKRIMVTQTAAPTLVNPRSAATDGSYVWIARAPEDRLGSAESPVITVFDASTRRFVAEYDYSAVITTNGFRTINIDDSYVYAAAWNDDHVAIIDKTDGSIVGWAYTQTKAIDAISDGLGNLYVIVADYGSGTPVDPEGLQKFVISGCIGQPRSTKTYDAIITGTNFDGGSARRLEFGGGYLWACAFHGVNNLYKIDPATFTIVAANDDDGLGSGELYDLVYGFGYIWATTYAGGVFTQAVLQYDTTTLAVLNDIYIDTAGLERAGGITIGPDTAGNPNARIWITDADLTPANPSIHAVNPTGPAYDTSIVLGAANERQADDIVSTSTHLWIPAWESNGSGSSIPGAMVIDPTTGLDDGVLGTVSLDYRQPFDDIDEGLFVTVGASGAAAGGYPMSRGVENGQQRRMFSPFGYTSDYIGGYNFVAQLTAPRGIAYTGDAIWIADNVSHLVQGLDLAIMYDAEDRLLGSADISTLTPAGTNPVDLAFDGTYVWSANAGSNNVSRIRIHRVNVTQAGVPVDSFPSGGLGHTPTRIIFNGNYMFVCGGSILSRLDSSKNHTTLSGFTNMTDIVYDGLYIWGVDIGTEQLRKIDPNNMTLVDSVALTGTSTGGAKLTCDGSHIYVTRGSSSSVDAVHIDTHELTNIPINSEVTMGNGEDIVYDGTMVVIIGTRYTPSPTLGLASIDPTAKAQVGTGGGLSLGGSTLTKAKAIGPGFIVAFNDTAATLQTIFHLFRAEPPRFSRANFTGNFNSSNLSSSFSMGNPLVERIEGVFYMFITGGGTYELDGNVWATTPRPDARIKVIEINGTIGSNVQLNYKGAGNGPFIIHSLTNFGANTLTVDVDGTSGVISPNPSSGDTIMFYKGNGGITQINSLI